MIEPLCKLHLIVVGSIPRNEDWKTVLWFTGFTDGSLVSNMMISAELLFFPTAPCFGQAYGRATVGREDRVPSPPAAAHGAGKEWGGEAAGRAWNSYSLLVHPLAAQLMSFIPAGRKYQRCVSSVQTGKRAPKTKLFLSTILVTKPNLWSLCIRNEEMWNPVPLL